MTSSYIRYITKSNSAVKNSFEITKGRSMLAGGKCDSFTLPFRKPPAVQALRKTYRQFYRALKLMVMMIIVPKSFTNGNHIESLRVS